MLLMIIYPMRYNYLRILNIEKAGAELFSVLRLLGIYALFGFTVFAPRLRMSSKRASAYHDTHGTDKEILITIQKAVDASPELRSKKALIETFISGINDVEDVLTEWHGYVAQEKEKELSAIIADEKLNESETRKFIDNAFRDGEIKTTGTDIDKLMPPTSRFGGGNRAEKKRGIIKKLKGFFERFFGI